jgi:hypothetical protein
LPPAPGPGLLGGVAAVWYRFRAELRSRWRAWLALALIVGVAGGAVVALAAGARRTDSAYRRLHDQHDGYDVLVSLNTTSAGETDQALDAEDVARLPDVAEAAPTSSFFVSLGAGVGVLVPPDERIGTSINRFTMLEGRRPDPNDPTEAVVSFTLADQYDLHLGSEIQVVDPIFLGEPPPGAPPEEVARFMPPLDRVRAALPDYVLTVVGIEASPGEFPPQIEGTGRYLIHASPALYPLRNDLATFSEGADMLMVRLDGGSDDVDSFLADLGRLRGGDPVEALAQRDLAVVVDRSLHTQAVAMRLLALLAAAAGALVAWQLLARLTLLESSDHPVLAALGMDRTARSVLGLARAAAIGLGAAVVAAVVAVAASPLFPTVLARTAEPDPGLDVDAVPVALGAAGLAVLVVLLTAWPAWRAAQPPARAVAGAGGVARSTEVPSRPSLAGRLVARRRVPLSAATGVRMALEPGRGSSSVPVRSSLAGVTLGVATLVGAVTFGASLAHLLATPELYGQTWDVELTTYDDVLARRGVPVLEDDPRVGGIVVGNFRAGFAVAGERVDGFAIDAATGDMAPPILEGRRPDAADEIALGTRTLRSLDLDVGDTVPVAPFAAGRDPVPMRIVGRAVFPVFGEVGRLGDGVFVGAAGWERIAGRPLDPADTGLLVRLAPGASRDGVVDDLGDEIGDPVFPISQGKPTDIVNFGRVEATPYVLGAILAALSAATLAHLLASAVRRRRRELAVLKTLGFVRGQVRATVAWQATTLVVVALVVGVPLGVAAGRWAWTLFADGLGVVAVPRVPGLVIAAVAVGALAVANLVAAVPAHVAARTRPALVLRSE